MINSHGLRQNQEAFARSLAEGMSQANAYRAAYKSGSRMKPQTLHSAASRLANDVKVRARVEALQTMIADMSVLTGAEIIAETRRLALSRASGIMHPDGRVKLPHELDPAIEASIASFEIDDLGRIKYKFWDKNSALERGARLLGMFKEDNEQSRPVPVHTVQLVALESVPVKK